MSVNKIQSVFNKILACIPFGPKSNIYGTLTTVLNFLAILQCGKNPKKNNKHGWGIKRLFIEKNGGGGGGNE